VGRSKVADGPGAATPKNEPAGERPRRARGRSGVCQSYLTTWRTSTEPYLTPGTRLAISTACSGPSASTL
jgi:hypothetical protein